jgi:hypothetical protein
MFQMVKNGFRPAIVEWAATVQMPRKGCHMTVRDLMPKFLALGEGHAGRGPEHPSSPVPQLRDRVEAFLAAHPALLGDLSYAEFLRIYGAASLSVPAEDDERWVCLLPGIIDDHWAFVPFSLEGFGVDSDGFLMVAQLFHQVSKIDLEFGYYTSGLDRPGMHRIAKFGSTNRAGPSSEKRGWYCHSFVEWLHRFVGLGEAMFDD